MATRKSKLETTFTGNSKPFEKVAARVRNIGTRLNNAFTGMKGAVAMLGGGMLARKALKDFDRIHKLQFQLGMSAEKIQGLGFAAEQSGSNIETMQAILTRLQRRLGDAENSSSASAKALTRLGLTVDDLAGKDPGDMFFTVAEAFRKTEGSAKGVSAVMQLLDTEVRSLFPMMMQTQEEIEELMGQTTKLTSEQLESIARLNDFMNFMAKEGLANVAGAIVKIVELVEEGIHRLKIFGVAMANFFQGGSIEDIASKIVEMENEFDQKKALRQKRVDKLKEQLAKIKDFEMPDEAAKKGPNIFDPTKQGGFFRTIGKISRLSAQAPKTMDQKRLELSKGILEQLKHSNEILKQATAR